MTAFGLLKSARIPVLPTGEVPDAKRSKEQYGWFGDVAIKVLSEMGVLLLDAQPTGTVVTSYPAPSDLRTILMVLGASGGATCYLYVNGAWTAMTPALYRSAYGGAGVITGGIGGTANALTLGTLSTPIQSLASGQLIGFQPTLNNTGAATLEVGAFGAKPIVRDDGSALSGGELLAGRQYLAIYDGSGWQLTGNAINFTSSTTPPANPSVMDEWYNPGNSTLFKRIFNGASYVWQAISVAASAVVTVVDNLTTASATSALSANQGVVLSGLVTAAQNTANSAQATANSAVAGLSNVPAVGSLGIGSWIYTAPAINAPGRQDFASSELLEDYGGTWRRYQNIGAPGSTLGLFQRIA